MYKYKDNDIVSLKVNFTDLVPSSEEITQDELRLVTSDAHVSLSTEKLTELQGRFKKINYTILDGDKNRKGFGITSAGMQIFVDHFNATKEDKDLHNFFKDHDYGKIDSMLGRIIETTYDKKNNRVRRTALIDLRHPTAQRLDMFQNLSTTLLHGKPMCSECGSQYMSCSHVDSYPESSVAYGIEDSLVTQSAYPNAKRDSLNMFESSLSTIDIAKEYFDKQIIDIDKLAAESKLIEKEETNHVEEERVKVEADKSAEQTRQKKAKENEEKEHKEIVEIKDNVKALKDIIEKDVAL